MKKIQQLGLAIFIIALTVFTIMPFIGQHELSISDFNIENETHREAILEASANNNILDRAFSLIAFSSKLDKTMKQAQQSLNQSYDVAVHKDEWSHKMGDWNIKSYSESLIRQTSVGMVTRQPLLFLFLTFGLAIIGGLLYIIPIFFVETDIKHDGIFFNSMTRGIPLSWQKSLITLAILGILAYGYIYMGYNFIWPIISLLLAVIIYVLVRSNAKGNSKYNINPAGLGIFAGIYLIAFYIVLYWFPIYANNWIIMVDPVSKSLSGNAASRWFLYGLMYSVIVLVMGIRMLAKYRHNRYQRIRTFSVIFFQLAFAFLIPEILVRFNQPWFDFKNAWPLDYDFFYDYQINEFLSSGGMGLFMLIWGILMIIVIVPVMTYFYGKRWYCSWVCGCGGLAETLGDPYRQLSDKSLKAWQYERYIIHGVLAFAIVMTIMVLYSYFTGSNNVLIFDSNNVRTWYGFLIGSAFAGVVGTGFYPLMGNRVWCRYGCPLAAYMGIVQRFKSRFRITTNGGQCISCGNCSTYCEMGIDVRSYAQKGQDIVRASCVGCGVCAAVCPRGVLKLENASSDINHRAQDIRNIHVAESDVRIL